MGLLYEGTYLSWDETKKIGQTVKKRAVKQFVNYYDRLKNKDRRFDLKYGDEVEYMIVKFDRENRKARVSLTAHEVLERIYDHETNQHSLTKCSIWMPEYAAYMLEGIPREPFRGLLSGGHREIEDNLKQRRNEVRALLTHDELLLSVSTYPRLGCEGFSWPTYQSDPDNSITGSIFVADEILYPHQRFRIVTRDMMLNRGTKVNVNVPIFKDVGTPLKCPEQHTSDDAQADDENNTSLPGDVYMDATVFGLGNCCLQVTLQAYSVEEARVLYDQLATFCPLMLALTAASPVFRGYLTEIDSQWRVTCKCMDCRSTEEKGVKPLKNYKYRIHKSRYESISLYLTDEGLRLNDTHAPCDVETYKAMRKAGIDHWLSQHIGYHFIRQPMGLVKEVIEEDDDEKDIRMFQAVYMTNYLSMRLKFPSLESDIGWRVEFRPCETQITDFENAAVICFVMLLSRTILSYKLSFLIPISKVDENMKIAEKMNAVISEKFWFRKNIINFAATNAAYEKPICVQLTISEIMNGNDDFVGIVPLVNSYVSDMELDTDTYITMSTYLNYIKQKSTGRIPTVASWIRAFVRAHPAYKFDSIVSEEINYDLLSTIGEIQDGKVYESYIMMKFGQKKTRQ